MRQVYIYSNLLSAQKNLMFRVPTSVSTEEEAPLEFVLCSRPFSTVGKNPDSQLDMSKNYSYIDLFPGAMTLPKHILLFIAQYLSSNQMLLQTSIARFTETLSRYTNFNETYILFCHQHAMITQAWRDLRRSRSRRSLHLSGVKKAAHRGRARGALECRRAKSSDGSEFSGTSHAMTCRLQMVPPPPLPSDCYRPRSSRAPGGDGGPEE